MGIGGRRGRITDRGRDRGKHRGRGMVRPRHGCGRGRCEAGQGARKTESKTERRVRQGTKSMDKCKLS